VDEGVVCSSFEAAEEHPVFHAQLGSAYHVFDEVGVEFAMPGCRWIDSCRWDRSWPFVQIDSELIALLFRFIGLISGGAFAPLRPAKISIDRWLRFPGSPPGILWIQDGDGHGG